jgi:hypothetical protein
VLEIAGKPASHGSFITGKFGGVADRRLRQRSLGGWDPDNGSAWTKPPQDFNATHSSW